MTEDALPSRFQLLVSRLAAVLVVVAGAGVLVAGVQRTSAFGGEEALVGRLSRVSQPLVVTAAGLTDLAGARLRVRAASASVSVPVFIGVGRADDVEAYLGKVARAEVTAVEEGGDLRVVARAGEPALPDPAGVDVWAASVRAAGVATLTWPRTPGRWLLVVATDGRTPPSAAEFAWSGRAGASPAPAMIAVGAVLFVLGLAALLAMRSGHLLAAMVGGRSKDTSQHRSEIGTDTGSETGAVTLPDADRPRHGRRAAGPASAEPPAPSTGAPRSPELSPRRAARLAATGALPLPPSEPVVPAPEVGEVPEGPEGVVEQVLAREPAGEFAQRPAAAADDADAGAEVEADEDADEIDEPPPVLPFRRGGASGGSAR